MQGRTQIRISRPVKSLLPRGGVKNARNIYPLFLRFLPCHRTKSDFTGCIAVLSEIFFVQTKQQNLGNTLCITEIFYEVWAEKSRSKPTSPYPSPPNRLGFFFNSLSPIRGTSAHRQGLCRRGCVCPPPCQNRSRKRRGS